MARPVVSLSGHGAIVGGEHDDPGDVDGSPSRGDVVEVGGE
jgi:hypothetical protein